MHPSTDAKARPSSLPDLMGIMAWPWSMYLHGQRVIRNHSEVICSPCPWIMGKIFQNPGDTGMYTITMADLGLTSQIAQQIGPNRTEERLTIAD